MSERNTFTLRIRPDLMKSIKLMSVERDTTMSDLVEEAIAEFLKKNTDKKQSKK